MPVEIEGETIWVECVPGGAGERQVGRRINFFGLSLFFNALCILELIPCSTLLMCS